MCGKDFVAINGSECVRALTCIAIDDPLGGGRREELSARLWQLGVVRGDSLWQP